MFVYLYKDVYRKVRMMTRLQFDITPFLEREEGQTFERKSLFEGKPGSKSSRDRRAIRDQIAKWVAGFANADGGVLILGIEDDFSITGHDLRPADLNTLLKVPEDRLDPAQENGFVINVGEHELIVFDVRASDTEVMVIGDGFPLRIGDTTTEVSVEEIRSSKFSSMSESWSSRPSSGLLEDLDEELLGEAKKSAGKESWTDEEYLLRSSMAHRRGRQVILRNAAELLFNPYGGSHTNAGIRIFQVVGTELLNGTEYNAKEIDRIEGNLPTIVEEASSRILNLLKSSTPIMGGKFREVPEYPYFAWQEALVNAVLHRDYAVEGQCIEIHLYNDRIEITNPGGLVKDVDFEKLINLERVHRSRNSLIAKAMTDLGIVRDQGEGIPRMFSEMEDAFLPKPMIETSNLEFKVTLRNTPTLTAADKKFISRLGNSQFSDVEFRALLQAHRYGKVDNAYLRNRCGLDTLKSSKLLSGLCDQKFLKLHPHGPNSYYTLSDSLVSQNYTIKLPQENDDRNMSKADNVASDSGETPFNESKLFESLRGDIDNLGERPRREKLRPIIHKLCSQNRWMTLNELSSILGYSRGGNLRDHLNQMIDEGQIERRFPHNPKHPKQAYRATNTFYEDPKQDS